jgi:serine/threonine protein kinase
VADRGRVYSILTFLGRGCDFFDVILKNGLFDRDVIRHVFYGATKSVYMMHGLGYSHRDLSCENICKFDYAFDLLI